MITAVKSVEGYLTEFVDYRVVREFENSVVIIDDRGWTTVWRKEIFF